MNKFFWWMRLANPIMWCLGGFFMLIAGNFGLAMLYFGLMILTAAIAYTLRDKV